MRKIISYLRDIPVEQRELLRKRLFRDVVVGAADECWLFVGGGKTQKGYGSVQLNYLRGYVHRLAYLLLIGEIPDKMKVCHSCDNPPCCNPAHLFTGTQSENIKDSVSKGRHHQVNKHQCPRGHPYSAENTKQEGNVRRCLLCRRLQLRKAAARYRGNRKAINTA